MRAISILLAAALSLSACDRLSGSRFNPFNWFDRPARADVLLGARAVPAETRPLMDQVVDLTVASRPGGAILRATGIPTQQGYFDGALVPVPEAGPGILAFAFRLQPPPVPTRISTPRSREVTVAVSLSDRQLRGIREIRVSGARNALAVRR